MNLCLFWQIEMRDFILKVKGVLHLVITIRSLKVSIVAHRKLLYLSHFRTELSFYLRLQIYSSVQFESWIQLKYSSSIEVFNSSFQVFKLKTWIQLKLKLSIEVFNSSFQLNCSIQVSNWSFQLNGSIQVFNWSFQLKYSSLSVQHPSSRFPSTLT